MGGCWGSSGSRQMQIHAYLAYLTDIYSLIGFEEQNLKFPKRAEIIAYYNDSQQQYWPQIQVSFKQLLKSLIDHIEAYKVRLIDTSLFVENKIKTANNPLIILMSMIIISELVENLHKFVLQKEVIMTNREEDSKLDIHDGSGAGGVLSVTYISDNFLRFELIFSGFLALLITQKQKYNIIWFEYAIKSLQNFSQHASRPYQSEQIHTVIEYLENILILLFTKHNGQPLPKLEHLFTSDSEDQKAFVDLVENLNQTMQDTVLSTYIDTISMVEYDKLFLDDNQRYLMRLILLTYQQHYKDKDNIINNYNKLCGRYILILSRRSFKLSLFEDLFQALFQHYDSQLWNDSELIQKIMDKLIYTAQKEGFVQNVEFLLLSRFLQYTQQQTQIYNEAQKRSQDNLQINIYQNQMKQSVGMLNTTPRNGVIKEASIMRTVIKMIGHLLTKFESKQYLLFSLENILRTLLINLKQYSEDREMVQDTFNTLQVLIQLFSPDTSAFSLYLGIVINISSAHQQSLQSSKSLNQSYMEVLLEILHLCIVNGQKYQTHIFLREEMIQPILQLTEQMPEKCLPILKDLLTLQIQEKNMSELNEVQDSHVYQMASHMISLVTYRVIQLAQKEDLNPQSFLVGLDQMSQVRDECLLLSLIVKLLYWDRYDTVQNKQSLQPAPTLAQQALYYRGLIGVVHKHPTKELSIWANNQLNVLEQLKVFQKLPQDPQEVLHNLQSSVIEPCQYVFQYLDLHEWVDFDSLEAKHRVFMDNLVNQNEDFVNLEEIQVQDKLERNSLNQSFVAQNSVIDLNDGSFEKVLNTVKKTKLKQGRIDMITTSEQQVSM